MLKIVSPNDQHVWFDSLSTNSSWKTIIQRESIINYENFCTHINQITPWFKDLDYNESKKKVTNYLIKSISSVVGKDEIINLNFSSTESIGEYLHNNIQVFNDINLPTDIPSTDIHRMQKSQFWIGDFYSANLVSNTLSDLDIEFKESEKYLDLGCSSGSLLRVLNWFYPKAFWFGCDPVGTSIDWATERLSGIDFSLSNQSPPLPHESNKFDGVISISVWSHHGSTACRNWFEEVHRVLKPGGWFLFTAHGPRSIYYYANSERYRSKGLERWISIYEGLLQNYHVFEQVWMIDDDAGNNANDWGNFYVKPEWIITNLAENFFPKLYYRGANQSNQDLYIFQKKF